MHPLRWEPSLLELQLGFSFIWCYHHPVIHQGPQDLSHDQSFCLSFPSLATRDASLSWPETKFKTHFLGDLLQILPFSLLDIESKVINRGCTEENEAFQLKAKGDEMRIWCSTVEQSESTGTDPLLRITEGGYGAFKQQIFLSLFIYYLLNLF